MFIMKTTTILSILSAVASVSAHGYLSKVQVNGKTFTAPRPGNGGNNKSPIRSVSSPNPNYGTGNPAITCGPNSKPGSSVIDLNPGDVMSFDWEGADGSNWPHNTGPMITYMASCGDKSCNDIGNPAGLKWFKVGQEGRDNSGKWAQAALMSGGTGKATVPQQLAPGNYMVRHEIIALHLATQQGKAEFYPGCVAVRVGGNGKGVPQGNLATFPGTYKDTDAGIFTPGVFNTRVAYKFPGPQIATFAAGSGGAPAPAPPAPSTGNNNNNNNGGNGGSNTGSGTTPKPSTGSSSSCGNKKKSKRDATPADTDVDTEEVILKPRVHSRVMRRLVNDLASAGHVH